MDDSNEKVFEYINNECIAIIDKINMSLPQNIYDVIQKCNKGFSELDDIVNFSNQHRFYCNESDTTNPDKDTKLNNATTIVNGLIGIVGTALALISPVAGLAYDGTFFLGKYIANHSKKNISIQKENIISGLNNFTDSFIKAITELEDDLRTVIRSYV